MTSVLPCRSDLVALRLLKDKDGHRYWRMDQLRAHVAGCPSCSYLLDVFSAMTGAQGGKAGRGAAKSLAAPITTVRWPLEIGIAENTDRFVRKALRSGGDYLK